MSVTKKKELVADYLKTSKVAVEGLLEAVQLSLNAWYYKPKVVACDKLEVKAKIEKVLEDYSYYGYKRVTKELKRRNTIINHKRIYKIMGEYYLVQPKKLRFAPKTTNSNHKLIIYPNEIKHLGKVIPGWVWVSDITYIPVGNRWAYLALIMDQGSRKIVGWCLRYSMDVSLCLDALNMALKFNLPPKYHHSDKGSQYCAYIYIGVLTVNKITPSMADVGMSVDNPYAESLNRSVKVEEVHRNVYPDLPSAIQNIGAWIDNYNHKRLHSSLGYIPPVEYLENYQKNQLQLEN